MDPAEVTARDGIFAGFVVCLAIFIGGIVWWFIRSKSKSDANADRVSQTLLDMSVRTIEKVGTSVEKVGDNIDKQSGHMQALTASTQLLQTTVAEGFREHKEHLLEIRKSLGARQA